MSIQKRSRIQRKFYMILVIGIILSLVFVMIIIYNQPSDDSLSLFAEDYQKILDDIGEPVLNPIIPTIEQVNSWLHLDKTDEILYIENIWMCSDFAAMLTINAKEKSWRMRVAIIYYSIEDESEYGKISPYGNNGHAFNMIYCQDGSDPDTELDVWYIEPQYDTIWQINYNHYIIYNYYNSLPETIWDTTYWVNYYDYLG